MIDIHAISKKVLERLTKLDYEKHGGNSSEQLIFPQKRQAKGVINRISEQELRFLFIEEFKLLYPDLFYSIETPTSGKFSFVEDVKIDPEGQSASHDMCIFKRVDLKYQRIFNIEFKHRNSGVKKSGKDILKLMFEKQDGVFIHLLENTNKGTLPSVFSKLYDSFYKYQEFWNNEDKFIDLVLLSLQQKKLIYSRIYKRDLINLNDIFLIESGCNNITDFKGIYWKTEELMEFKS